MPKYTPVLYRLQQVKTIELKTGDYFVIVENNEMLEGIFAATADGSAVDVEAVKVMNVVPAEPPRR